MTAWTARQLKILDRVRFLRVSTISPRGDPFTVPLRFYFDGTSLYFALVPTSQQDVNLRANRRLAVLVDTSEGGSLQGFVVQGLAQRVRSGREADAVWEAMVAKYPDRPAKEAGGALIRIDPVRIEDLGES